MSVGPLTVSKNAWIYDVRNIFSVRICTDLFWSHLKNINFRQCLRFGIQSCTLTARGMYFDCSPWFLELSSHNYFCFNSNRTHLILSVWLRFLGQQNEAGKVSFFQENSLNRRYSWSACTFLRYKLFKFEGCYAHDFDLSDLFDDRQPFTKKKWSSSSPKPFQVKHLA